VTIYYIVTFVLATLASLVITPAVRDVVIRGGWLDKPSDGRHSHTKAVPRLGGVAIFAGFTLAAVAAFSAAQLLDIAPGVSIRTLLGILLPACLIFVLGLLDDIYSLGPYLKFGVQAVAALWLYWGGFGIHLLAFYSRHATLGFFMALPLTIFWVLLITNAFNLIDGLDGLSAGSALFSTLIIFAVALIRHTPLVSILSIVLAGVIFGFLRYNFHPASIFLGDSGSLFIGFLLSALALASSQKSTTVVAVAIPVVAFGLPLLDVCLSVLRRYMNGKPLFIGDEDHVHHKLIKRGFSHGQAVLVLYAVAAAFGILSLTLLHSELMIGFVLLLVGLGVWLGVQQLRYVELYEVAAFARLIWRRKRITANNLQVRRAMESFPNQSLDFAELCHILQSALACAGFCGVSISVPQVGWIDETLLFPLRRINEGEASYLWANQDLLATQWQLKLELTSSSGARLGDLNLFRESASDPLLVDMNLLGDEFRIAISVAVERALGRISEGREAQEKSPSILARAASANQQVGS
jgi:UDP-GlcNAc:undecaprenyl-phosphate GlcNAc-1-phosphate transferase